MKICTLTWLLNCSQGLIFGECHQEGQSSQSFANLLHKSHRGGKSTDFNCIWIRSSRLSHGAGGRGRGAHC